MRFTIQEWIQKLCLKEVSRHNNNKFILSDATCTTNLIN